MSDCTPEMTAHTSIFSRLFSLLLPDDDTPASDRHLDAKTRHAVRDLSPHLRRDIGLSD